MKKRLKLLKLKNKNKMSVNEILRRDKERINNPKLPRVNGVAIYCLVETYCISSSSDNKH